MSSEVKKVGYDKGYQDALATYGRVCSGQSDCSSCQVGVLKGLALSCQDFMRMYPEKMQSVLLEASSQELTFFREYCLRFTQSTATIEEIADSVCRKLIFEGSSKCEGGDCLACWKMPFTGDVEED